MGEIVWPAEQLRALDEADELEIAGRRWTPIWVVRVEDQVFVRTWHRRDTGWFGHVLREGRATVRVPGVEAAVTVEDVGVGPAGLRDSVDAAYRAKYGRYGEGTVARMVSDTAAGTTLRLSLS
ncbi:DUF2255 family protein [Actinoplanes sp. NBRC 103695]|uniref:DUF2255 family protein n=1 Tax=Actinoplanes sp. NBRC 103695 TaxID=3032202 RepID=UPI0024A2E16C|nr:DUF2255 family protein [Actinoplanes sp. NBRC 103695]GLY95147.1 hypothetical protein Acsp02_24020 [Actinoplanes sp. NBRC 103695]